MKGNKRKLLLILMLLSSFVLVQESRSINLGPVEGGGGLLFGDNYLFDLRAPKGWVFDNQSGEPHGLDAVIYRVGDSWKKARVFMYPQVWQKTDNMRIEDIITEDIAKYRQKFPDVVVKDVKPITVDSGAVAIVKYFEGGNYDSYEAIAYFDEPKVVVMIILYARTKELFDSSQTAFSALLNSYKFIGEFQEMPN